MIEVRELLGLISLAPCPRLVRGCQLTEECRRPRLICDPAGCVPELLSEGTAIVAPLVGDQETAPLLLIFPGRMPESNGSDSSSSIRFRTGPRVLEVQLSIRMVSQPLGGGWPVV